MLQCNRCSYTNSLIQNNYFLLTIFYLDVTPVPIVSVSCKKSNEKVKMVTNVIKTDLVVDIFKRQRLKKLFLSLHMISGSGPRNAAPPSYHKDKSNCSTLAA